LIAKVAESQIVHLEHAYPRNVGSVERSTELRLTCIRANAYAIGGRDSRGASGGDDATQASAAWRSSQGALDC
jgi:hypothetical protein